MICELCNGLTLEKRVKKQHWLQNKLYIVENVTAEVCLECGERYYHATVLDEIDHFLKTEHKVKERIDIEVVTL
jgi:YgiT-type zinc finger domain-containing protein